MHSRTSSFLLVSIPDVEMEIKHKCVEFLQLVSICNKRDSSFDFFCTKQRLVVYPGILVTIYCHASARGHMCTEVGFHVNNTNRMRNHMRK